MVKNTKELAQTLIRGRDYTHKLQNLLRRKENGDGSDSANGLVMEILGCLTVGLSMLNSCDSGEISGVPASPCSVDRKPEVYTGKKAAPAVKERRGCYKRRKTIDSRVKISETIEDGSSWRKYGQKEILNSKFPRCYFRCTHKLAHGCKAQKQVQKLDDGSNKFHITYFGTHTCPTRNSSSHSIVVLDFNDSENHRYFQNAPSSFPNIHIDPSIKHEAESKAQSTDFSDNISSANDDHSPQPQAFGWMDVMIDDHLGHGHELTSLKGFDHEDSSASTSSPSYMFDMDFLNDDVDLLNEFL